MNELGLSRVQDQERTKIDALDYINYALSQSDVAASVHASPAVICLKKELHARLALVPFYAH